jgi:hypothetical protein
MGSVWRDTPEPRPAPQPRTVVHFSTYDSAVRDARLRGACAIIDAHFRFWSTPTELTILEVHSRILRTLRDELITPADPLAGVIVMPAHSFGNPSA